MPIIAMHSEDTMAPTQYWLIVGFLLVGGLFSILGGWMDWDFFMENRKAKRLVALIGRKGARIFYGALGAALVVGGGAMLLIGPAALIESEL